MTLFLALVGVILFSWWYFANRNPVEVVKKVIAGHAVPTPKHLFTIYGNGKDFLNKPMGTVVMNNRIYVANTKNHEIMMFDYNGKYLKSFGGDSLIEPVGLAAGNGQLYVADAGSRLVSVYDQEGKFKKIFAEKKVIMPIAVALDKEKVYILDGYTVSIRSFDYNGKQIANFGGLGKEKGKFYFPFSLTLDSKGHIYVADSNNNRIQVFDSKGTFVKALNGKDSKGNGGYSIPRGLAFDNKGYLYTAEGLSHLVSIANAEGKVISRFSYGENVKKGQPLDNMKLPTNVFIDDNQRLYVTEYGKSRVLVYDLK